MRPSVREFYRLNHTHQSGRFRASKAGPSTSRCKKREMSVWEAMEYLNRLTDDSDPDTELPQIEHSLQTLLAIRGAGHPRWFQLVGLIHDLGKVLCLFDEPQWAVVGDTFPVGCRFSEKIVFPEFFAGESRQPGARVSDAARHLRGGLRSRQRADVVGPRRVPVITS